MKAVIILFMGLMPVWAFSTACNKDTYQDYIYTAGVHRCNLVNAKLQDADLSGAN